MWKTASVTFVSPALLRHRLLVLKVGRAAIDFIPVASRYRIRDPGRAGTAPGRCRSPTPMPVLHPAGGQVIAGKSSLVNAMSLSLRGRSRAACRRPTQCFGARLEVKDACCPLVEWPAREHLTNQTSC